MHESGRAIELELLIGEAQHAIAIVINRYLNGSEHIAQVLRIVIPFVSADKDANSGDLCGCDIRSTGGKRRSRIRLKRRYMSTSRNDQKKSGKTELFHFYHPPRKLIEQPHASA